MAEGRLAPNVGERDMTVDRNPSTFLQSIIIIKNKIKDGFVYSVLIMT